MPPLPIVEVETAQHKNDENVHPTEAAPASKAIIGIIYPPPEVRNIVDKTASFVSRNGPEFETRIRQNEINNPKFNFLNPTDPYYAYYQHKVKEFKEGKGVEPLFKPTAQIQLQLQQPQLQRQEQQQKIIEQIIPKEPPAEYEFVADPPSIAAFDLDIVKLTAQFVARNGRQFLTNLMNREQRNYQFDFLRPQHSLFNYFTKLVEQYTKILIPPKDLLPKLRKEAETPKVILEKVKHRVDWVKFQEREKRREEEEREKERTAYAQIDWHDFVIVETVDFQLTETGNLPPPTTPEEVGARVLAQERYEMHGNAMPHETVEMEVVSEGEDEDDDDFEALSPPSPPTKGDDNEVLDMDHGSDDEEERNVRKKTAPGGAGPPMPPMPPKDKVPQPPPLPPVPDQVIVKDYNPKAKVLPVAPPAHQYTITSIGGETVPADRIQEHLRIRLLDPKWIEQRDRSIREKQEQEEVLAHGLSIEQNLKLLAERRTDIFGSGAEETQIGKKIGEEELPQPTKIIWDGHTASMEKVTQKARENISIEEQIAVIHRVKGLVADEEKEKIGPTVPKPPSIPPPILPPQAPSSQPTMYQQPPPFPPAMPPMPPQVSAVPPRVPPPTPQTSVPPFVASTGSNMPTLPQSRPPMPQPTQGMPQPTQGMGMGGPPPMQQSPMHLMMMGQPGGPMAQMGGMGLMRPMGLPQIPTQQRFMAPPPPMMQGQPPQQPMAGGGGALKRPANQEEDSSGGKKLKTEDQLMPEHEFLQRNKPPVGFRVQIPVTTEKTDWKLNGQVLIMTLPLTDSVSVIKAKIHEEIGMPVGKQKLQIDGLFLKDSNTLAFYNFTTSYTVQLQLKERGGRKK